MNFNMPSQGGVHHDRTPESIMKQRAEDAAKIVEFQKAKSDALARGEEFDAEKYYDQKDREEAEAKQSPAAAVQETLETEATPIFNDLQTETLKPNKLSEADSEMLKTIPEGMRVPDMNPEQRKAYGEAMRINKELQAQKAAERAAREKLFIATKHNQDSIDTYRHRLFALPLEGEASGTSKEKEPSPVTTGQEIYYPDLGDTMYVLSVNEGDKTITLVETLEELQKAQALAERNGTGLREAGGRQIPISFVQAKEFLKNTPIKPANNVSRYDKYKIQRELAA